MFIIIYFCISCALRSVEIERQNHRRKRIVKTSWKEEREVIFIREQEKKIILSCSSYHNGLVRGYYAGSGAPTESSFGIVLFMWLRAAVQWNRSWVPSGMGQRGHGHMFYLLGTAGSCQLPLTTLHPCSTFITGKLVNIAYQRHKVTEILSLP